LNRNTKHHLRVWLTLETQEFDLGSAEVEVRVRERPDVALEEANDGLDNGSGDGWDRATPRNEMHGTEKTSELFVSFT
jgi:hypothetical protein